MSVMSIINGAQDVYAIDDLFGRRGFHASATASVFGVDITGRIAKGQGISSPSGETGLTPDAGAGAQEETDKLANLQKLESALSDTVNYLVEKFGEKAGTAMMGIVYKGLGNSAVDEVSLGNAFLDVTRFVDKNFGIKEGDAFMAHLNGSLNEGLNAYFDNGLNEQFMAVTKFSGASVNADISQKAAEGVEEAYLSGIMDMLEQARTENAGNADAKNPYLGQKRQKISGILRDSLV